jgi:FkbM family methyltransferase
MMNPIKLRFIYWKLFFARKLSFEMVIYVTLPGFLRPQKDIKVKLYGNPFIVPNGELHVFSSQMAQIIAMNQYRVELIRGAVIDAGANTGVFSIFAAVTHPDAVIYAFEPAPHTLDVLKENTKYYSKVFNCGLGEENKTASIVVAHECQLNYIGDGGIPVEVKTIDSLDVPISFLKIDTEGYEANILRGAAEAITKYKPVIAMSAYHKPGDRKELPALLKGICPEYTCELHHDAEEVFICHCG